MDIESLLDMELLYLLKRKRCYKHILDKGCYYILSFIYPKFSILTLTSNTLLFSNQHFCVEDLFLLISYAFFCACQDNDLWSLENNVVEIIEYLNIY